MMIFTMFFFISRDLSMMLGCSKLDIFSRVETKNEVKKVSDFLAS